MQTVEEIKILLKTRQWIFLTILSYCLQNPVINSSKEKKMFTCTEIEAVLGKTVKTIVKYYYY